MTVRATGALLALMLCAAPASAKTASASLEGIGANTWATGTVHLTEENNGLRIRIDVKSVNPGKHGIHIHENGSCEKQGAAAGNHFNPAEVQHGNLIEDGVAAAHAGDLGNITVEGDGTGHREMFVPVLSLSRGPYNVMNRAIILREKEDDFGQPAGNSGGRVACGVIK